VRLSLRHGHLLQLLQQHLGVPVEPAGGGRSARVGREAVSWEEIEVRVNAWWGNTGREDIEGETERGIAGTALASRAPGDPWVLWPQDTHNRLERWRDGS
jgi:hypothetical protein